MVDNMNVLFLTPLPGTRLWKHVKAEGRIALGDFPEDWKYYTLNYPVARYKYLNRDQIIQEMIDCNGTFYSVANILGRFGRDLLAGHHALVSLISGVSSRINSRSYGRTYRSLWPTEPLTGELEPRPLDRAALLEMWEGAVALLRKLAAELRLRSASLFRQS
jgi:hypothetical protein